jgi:pyruvate/2-oxoglutarate dehydrogenase complex dihydrolipoamide acyltransferase (E2) component
LTISQKERLMLYAKKDLFSVDEESGRRFQVAFAGQLVPQEFEHLVATADVQEVATPAEAQADPSIIPPDAPNATDAAIDLARENGIDLATISGSGKDGRIVEGDVKEAVDAAATR